MSRDKFLEDPPSAEFRNRVLRAVAPELNALKPAWSIFSRRLLFGGFTAAIAAVLLPRLLKKPEQSELLEVAVQPELFENLDLLAELDLLEDYDVISAWDGKVS